MHDTQHRNPELRAELAIFTDGRAALFCARVDPHTGNRTDEHRADYPSPAAALSFLIEAVMTTPTTTDPHRALADIFASTIALYSTGQRPA